MKYTRCVLIFSLLIMTMTAGITYWASTKQEHAIMHKPKVVAAIDKEFEQYPLTHTQGKVPNWLNGTFVRNGPVGVQINDQKLAHWFDGPAMLHAFKFQNGAVSYTNKFLRSAVYDTIFIKGSLNYSGFASSSSFSLRAYLQNLFFSNSTPKIQNANVNVSEIADQYVALTETPLPVVFDISHLNTQGPLLYEDNLPKSHIFESAHIQCDGKTEEKINYLVEYGKDSQYVVYQFNPRKPERQIIGKVPVKNPSYMHSFALTEHYVILVEFPLTVNPIDLALMRKPFIKNFNWHPENGTRFLVIDRKTGKLLKNIKYDTPFFAFHHVNAYEEGDNIILDMVVYPNANIILDVAQYENIDEPLNQNLDKKDDESHLIRYTISMPQERIDSSPLLNSKVEFPRINDEYIAYPHRYVYAVNPSPVHTAQDLRPLYKIDTLTREKLLWQAPGLQPGEPVFISKPHAKEEDEGVIVSLVLDIRNPNSQQAFLLILDGKSFKELARLYTPQPIPVGLHGQFFKY